MAGDEASVPAKQGFLSRVFGSEKGVAQQLETLRTELDGAKAQLHATATRLDEAEAEAERLRSELSVADEALGAIEAERTEEAAKAEAAREKALAGAQMVRKLTAEVEALRQTDATHRKAQQASTERVSALRAELRAAKEEKLRSQFAGAGGGSGALKRQLDEARGELDEARRALGKATKGEQVAKDEAREAQKKLEDATEALRRAEKSNDGAKKLRAELEALTQERDGLARERDAAVRERDRAKAARAKVEVELSEAKKASALSDQQRRELEGLRKGNTELQERIATINEEVEAIRTERDERAARAQEVEAELVEVRSAATVHEDAARRLGELALLLGGTNGKFFESFFGSNDPTIWRRWIDAASSEDWADALEADRLPAALAALGLDVSVGDDGVVSASAEGSSWEHAMISALQESASRGHS